MPSVSALAPIDVESPILQRHWLIHLCKHSLFNCVKPPAKASVPQNIQLVAYQLTNTHPGQGGRLGSRASVDLIHKAVQERAIDQGLFCFWCHLSSPEMLLPVWGVEYIVVSSVQRTISGSLSMSQGYWRITRPCIDFQQAYETTDLTKKRLQVSLGESCKAVPPNGGAETEVEKEPSQGSSCVS
jgi:hypothetical protein